MIRWICSDFVHHEHKWKWSAWMCGRFQYWWKELLRWDWDATDYRNIFKSKGGTSRKARYDKDCLKKQ